MSTISHSYEYNYDDVKVWFSPDGSKINCSGSFFKGDWMSYQQVLDLEIKLKKDKEIDLFFDENARKSNHYFLGVTEKLHQIFEEKLKL